MGNPQVPLSLAYAGFHQATITELRHASEPPPAPVVWTQRLAGVRASLEASSPAKPAAAAARQGRYRVTRLSAQDLGSHKISPAEVQMIRARQAAAQAGRMQAAVESHNPEQQGTSGHLLTSRLHLSPPVLTTTDFAAIASSSVGGGMLGLRRPHTRFPASRNGNGLAVYVRRPMTTDHPGYQPAANESDEPYDQQAKEGEGAAGARSTGQGSPARTHRSHRRSSLPQPFSPPAEPPQFRRPYTSDVIRNTDSRAYSAWFQPPRATFLSSNPVPKLPSALRVDCGSLTERDFLMGLHDKQHRRLNPEGSSSLQGAQQDSEWFGAAPGQQVSENHATDGANDSPRSVWPAESGPPSPDSLASTGTRNAAGFASPPGYRSVKGVWRPDTAVSDTDILSRAGLQQGPAEVPAAAALPHLGAAGGLHGGAIRLGSPSVTILQAIKDASKSPYVQAQAFQFATDCRVTTLPVERHLPRRHVPALGK